MNRELKPSEPQSSVSVETLRTMSEFMNENWRVSVANVDTLEGTKAVSFFNFEKLTKYSLWEIKKFLCQNLPQDTYDYLKYERRRVQKNSKRNLRKDRDLTDEIHLEKYLKNLQCEKESLLKTRSQIEEEIRFYLGEMNDYAQ